MHYKKMHTNIQILIKKCKLLSAKTKIKKYINNTHNPHFENHWIMLMQNILMIDDHSMCEDQFM